MGKENFMRLPWTPAQAQRLSALNASSTDLARVFADSGQREHAFQKLEKQLTALQREQLKAFRETDRRPALCRLESRLVDVLVKQGFVQVTTPIIMARGLLAKMSIDARHPLNSQIYWLDKNKCLRPMLAPHLYYVLVDLLRLWDRPVRIFEVGPCFRKESHGAQHASEFTMLNLVEMGLPEQNRQDRIEQLAALVAKTARINDYRLEPVTSEVYGDTIDMVAGKEGLEVASAAMGPHRLDRPWKITDNWVGIGFGLERLLMAAGNRRNLAGMGRSLSYLNGIRLSLS
jgi:phenylalanyl-tRNA synthetase alpha chain